MFKASSFKPARPMLGSSRGELGWYSQPKVDGIRCILQIRSGVVQGWTRNWVPIALRGAIKVPYDLSCVLDGELVRDDNGNYMFYAFDVIQLGKASMFKKTTEFRLTVLDELLGNLPSPQIASVHDAPNKLIEGEVWKDPKTWYPVGKTDRWVKVLY